MKIYTVKSLVLFWAKTYFVRYDILYEVWHFLQTHTVEKREDGLF